MQYIYSAYSGAVALFTVAYTAKRLRLSQVPAESKKVRTLWILAIAGLIAWMLLTRMLAEVKLDRPVTYGLSFLVGLLWICMKFYDLCQINLALSHFQLQKKNWHRRHWERILGAQMVGILFTIFCLMGTEILLVFLYVTEKW